MLLFNKNKFRADCYILFEISIKFISGSLKYIEFNLPVAPSLWTGPISTSISFFSKIFIQSFIGKELKKQMSTAPKMGFLAWGIKGFFSKWTLIFWFPNFK